MSEQEMKKKGWKKEGDKWVKEVSYQDLMHGKKVYQIVEAESIDDLEKCVAGCLAEGYVPLGGVQVVMSVPMGELGKRFRFYQTMVFNEV